MALTSHPLRSLVLSVAVVVGALGAGATAAQAPRSLTGLFRSPDEPAPAGAAFSPPDGTAPVSPTVPASVDTPLSRDALFGPPAGSEDRILPPAGSLSQGQAAPAAGLEEAGPQVSGFVRSELAYTYADAEHWSLLQNLLHLGVSGRLDSGISWKVSGRAYYDPVYATSDFYPGDVRDDQKAEVRFWETYVDARLGGLEWRLGRQHIVWGEMVALFFADLVSAKDLRQSILPDFDYIRIPQWAARTEYFSGDFHAEAVWVPFMTYDEVGKPGADFYPFRPGSVAEFRDEDRPNDGLAHSGYGGRANYIRGGWDLAALFWSSPDLSPAFEREVSVARIPATSYRPVHERVHQYGGTLGKDFGWTVLKGEVIYTSGRPFETLTGSDADGLVRQDLLDYIVGLDFSFEEETRVNLQFFQRRLFDHEPGMVPDDVESGASALLSTRALHPKLEPEILFLTSLNRSDWNLQARVTWQFKPNWRVAGGVDIFDGPAEGLFGRFDATDRIHAEVRYDF